MKLYILIIALITTVLSCNVSKRKASHTTAQSLMVKVDTSKQDSSTISTSYLVEETTSIGGDSMSGNFAIRNDVGSTQTFVSDGIEVTITTVPDSATNQTAVKFKAKAKTKTLTRKQSGTSTTSSGSSQKAVHEAGLVTIAKDDSAEKTTSYLPMAIGSFLLLLLLIIILRYAYKRLKEKYLW